MKLIKTVYLSWATNTTYVAQANVHVPFNVKFAHVKAIGYVPATALSQYVVITSDLSENQPLGMVGRDGKYDNASMDVLIEYPVPKKIQGQYQFYLTLLTGLAGAGSNASSADTCAIVIEFYDETSFPPHIKTHPQQFLTLPTRSIV